MDYFPLFADLRGQPCLVVGGGTVAARKVRQLCRAGAAVTVNAPQPGSELTGQVERGEIAFVSGGFAAKLLTGSLLVIAATDDAALNREVAARARAAGILCNVVDDGAASSFIVPSVVDRSPLLVAVSTGGTAPMLARILRQQIAAWLPERIADLARWVARWRPEVAAARKGYQERLVFWQAALDGAPAEQLLAGREAAADQLLRQRLAGSRAEPLGEAWLVGAGPGDPELLTRRGLALLQRADAVLYDRLVAPALLEHARRDAELVCVGKRGGGPSASQADINRELVDRVRRGQRVCRLKGGDPFVFGRGGEELESLAAAGLPYQVVPGITAAAGCAAYAGIPLTHRELAAGVSFVTAQQAAGQPDWHALARSGHTLVIYMGGQRVAAVCRDLQAGGMAAATPAVLIEAGTTPDQRITGGRLADLPQRIGDVASPALLIVGQVAALGDRLQWFAGQARAERITV